MKNENGSSIKLGCIIVLLLLILIAIVLLIFIIWRAGLIPFDLFPTSDNSSQISASVEGPNSDERDIGYTEYTFLPFEFTFSVPSDWFVGTIDMPVEPGYGKCLEYHISSPGDFARIVVRPMCGSYGGGDMACPDSIVSVADFSSRSLGRYPASDAYSSRPGLTYTNFIKESNSCGSELVSNGFAAMEITA